MSPGKVKERIHLGWREWVSLPGLGIEQIKAKVDTGARTSALHAFSHQTFHDRGVLMVRFRIHPIQRRTDIEKECVAEVLERRVVSDSGGHREKRLVIATPVQLGERRWNIEMTLTNRDNMQFRMLLGRTAIKGHYVVDPGRSYLVGHKQEHRDD
jgi:hypothetical protein